MDASSQKNKKMQLEAGPVKIETDNDKIQIMKETAKWSVSKCLWPKVSKIIKQANKVMKLFLTKNFKVKEFHPMIKPFETGCPEELKKQLLESLEKKDEHLLNFENVTSNVVEDEVETSAQRSPEEIW